MPEAVPPDPLLKAKRPSVDLPSMAERKETLCFECGQVVGNPPLLNRHEDGESCRRCADRVLDALPSLLPRQVEEEASDVDQEESGHEFDFDLPGSDFTPDYPSDPA